MTAPGPRPRWSRSTDSRCAARSWRIRISTRLAPPTATRRPGSAPRRHLAVPPGALARCGTQRLRRSRPARWAEQRLEADRGARRVDDPGLRRRADLHERADALRRPAARRTRREPHRSVPHVVHGSAGVEGTAHRAPRGWCDQRALRVRERSARRAGEGQPVAVGVRHHSRTFASAPTRWRVRS